MEAATPRSALSDPTKKKKKRRTGSGEKNLRKKSSRVRNGLPLSASAVYASLSGIPGPEGKMPEGDVATSRSTGIGLTLVSLVMLLYMFGCVQSIRSLPELNPNMKPNWFGVGSVRGLAIHGGGNINVARDGLVAAEDDDDDDDDDGAIEASGDKGDDSATSVVPEHKWPVTIRDEDGAFEDITHPGDDTMTVTLPKFWSYPIHNNKLMTREQAMSIGSCIVPDEKGNIARGDDCPKNDRTVFVGIASYRDWQCRYTVDSIFTRAAFPERVRVGVVDQIVDGEDVSCGSPIEPCADNPDQALCKYQHLIDVYQMDAILAVGPVFARHVGYRMFRGEYYAMQSDAHVTYTSGWDVDIIDQQESTGNDMAVQSTYLTDITGSIDEKTGLSKRNTRPIMCNTHYEGGIQGQHLRHGSQPERTPGIHGMPQLEPYWAAGFSFSRGHFIVNVPYDQYQPMIFQGEEMSIGIRGFTIGYDYYATEKSICFHHYANGPKGGDAKRLKVKTFWEHADKYKGTGKRAMQRLLGIVSMNPEVNPSEWDHTEEERYGIGKVRTTQKFYDTFGVDVVNKRTEDNLCQFVQTGIMHKEFMKYLREDGIGIDYDRISYQFKDPGYNNS